MDVGLLAVIVSIVLAIVVFFVVTKCFSPDASTKFTDNAIEDDVIEAKIPLSQKRVKERGGGSRSTEQSTFSHPWLVRTLKGHGVPVLDIDYSSNGKFLVSCATDRSLLIWPCNQFHDKSMQPYRGNVEYDYAISVSFSPDSKAVIVGCKTTGSLSVYKVVKKDTGHGYRIILGSDLETSVGSTDLISVGISGSAKILMGCGGDTWLHIYDFKGIELKKIDTHLGNNHFATVSSCGRFIACSGFISEAKVWHINLSKSGEFNDVVHAFDLKGHSSGVLCVSFNSDSTRMLTISKDGTWRYWNTDVQFELKQDPFLLNSSTLDCLKGAEYAKCALSPDGFSFAIAVGSSVYSFEAETSKCVLIENAHSSPISAIQYSGDSNILTTTGDKHIHLFNNISGYQSLKNRSNKILHSGGKQIHSEAHRQRLQDHIKLADSFISKV